MILVASNRRCTRHSLARLTRGIGLLTVSAASLNGALAILHSQRITAAVCDADFPGGGWKAVLEALGALSVQPRLIVTSPLADSRLWTEVLNLGCYDVLAQPFEAGEVRRILSMACEACMAMAATVVGPGENTGLRASGNRGLQ